MYMALDMYSRKVVAWEVFAKEDGTLARDLFAKVQNPVHGDRLIRFMLTGRSGPS